MSEKITIFHSKTTKNKAPYSPFDDNTFVFETYNTESNLQMYSVMVSHFILNIPLEKLKKPVRTFRRKVNLDQYYDDSIKYFIIDVDEVKSEFNKQRIIEYFKDYKVILGESRSYNGIDNFNMKGILFTEDIPLKHVKHALSTIHHDLKDICVIDESVGRKASLNAPVLKNNIFINNEDGIRFKYVAKDNIDHINDIKNEYITKPNVVNAGSFFDNTNNLESLEADSMEKLCLKVFQSMGYTAVTNNPNGSISFKHPSEQKSPGGYFWFNTSPYTMHHANSTKSVNIFDSVRKLPQAKELMKKEIDYNDEFLHFNTDASVLTVDEKYLKVTDAVNNKIQTFLNARNGLLSIRSAMGTGKSTIINHIINECHELDMKVLVITNRISVANDFGRKYDMKVYNKDKYELGDSLICQYDSLWKYNIKFFDIIIMDEFISVMLHSRSNLNNSSVNIAKFFGSFNKKLVIADAFLTGYENFLLSNKTKNVHMIDNIYRDPSKLYNYSDFNYFVNSLVVHAEKKKITVSATSLSFIDSLQSLLTKRGLKVVTLTATTPASTKNLIYELFEKDNHDKWDVLIFSPTLTVGVSNMNNIDYHFHYDSSLSTDPISSIQMLKRTRKAKEIHMFVKEKINYLKTSYNEIRDEYMGNIGRNIEQNYLFSVDDYGEARLSDIGKKAIKIDTFKNILSFNHKDALMWLLKYHFLREPELISNKFQGNILYRYQKKNKEDKKNALMSAIDQFLSLNDMEKTDILLGADADKTLKILAEIDDEIIMDCPADVKQDVLEITLNDSSFIQKCKHYKIIKNYTSGYWDDTDLKNRVSKAVISGNNDDLHFYNTVLSYGQKEINDNYNFKALNDKQLKYILEKSGYKFEVNSFQQFGYRCFSVDKNVKKFYNYIK